MSEFQSHLSMEDLMLDLNAVIQHFLDEAISQQQNECQEQDEIAIAAIHDRGMIRSNREKILKRWLKNYGVLQGLNNDDRNRVAKQVIRYADSANLGEKDVCQNDILNRFFYLHSLCSDSVRPRKDGTHRDLSSLTSKSLWLCYPKSIPIFDSFAQRALWAISRLDHDSGSWPSASGPSTYTNFCSVWFHMYRSVKFEEVSTNPYPYKVRVFDKILWIIGQPRYGRVPYPPLEADARLQEAKAA